MESITFRLLFLSLQIRSYKSFWNPNLRAVYMRINVASVSNFIVGNGILSRLISQIYPAPGEYAHSALQIPWNRILWITITAAEID